MVVKSLLFLAFSTFLAMPGIRAYAQAHVTENQQAYIYVDQKKGADANSGTWQEPLRTIQAAVEKAKANNLKSIGTKVLINPGIYREFVNIQASYKQTAATIILEAAQTGTAVIAASDVMTNWSRDAGNSAVYNHSWMRNLGTCGVPSGWPATVAPVVRRTEMIFVNNIPLTQVMSFGQLREGTFYVNEADDVIHIFPSKYVNMSTAVVEAAVRPQTLSVSGRSNMVFRGLVFRHAASCINQHGATVGGSNNVLFDQVQAVWNNWGGLAISHSSNITVQNSVASHNGGVGFAGMTDKNALYQFNESDYNNWRGAMGALYDWGMGGTKLMMMHNATVNNHYSYRNQAQGLWFDTDNKNISISNATLSENVLASLQLEANEGPISLTGSKLCSSGSGANLINTESLTMKGNTFYNNSGTNKWQGQIFLAGKPGGRQIYDWETNQSYYLYTSNTVMSGNILQDTKAGQFVFATFLSGNDWTRFADSLSSNNNHWYDGSTKKAFKIPNGVVVDLASWQLETRADLASYWGTVTTAAASCAVPTPSFTDFSVNSDNYAYSMSGGKAVVNLRVNSFGYGQVNLAAYGVPPGVTAHFAQSSMISGATQLTLTSSTAATTRTVPITIFANSGGRVHSITVSVAVVRT
jgi:hypothetical protein